MPSAIRIRQCFKRTWHSNLLSGHEWPEDTLIDRWEVVGPCGVITTTRSFEAAETKAADHQAFYDRYALCPSATNG
jgi:hypothetical protein